MRTFVGGLLCALFLPFPNLVAQSPCDTAAISATLTLSARQLESGQDLQALETAQQALMLSSACSADSFWYERAILQTGSCNLALANTYLNRGMINHATDLIERTIVSYQSLQGKYPDRLAEAYLDLSHANGQAGNSRIAADAGLKALKVKLAASPTDPMTYNVYSSIITYFVELKDTAQAFHYLQEWEAYHRKLGAKASMQGRLDMANSWARYLDLKDRLKEGMMMIEDTIARYGEQIRARGGFLAYAEFNLTQGYVHLRDFEKALKYSEKNVAYFEARMKKQRGKLLSKLHYAWFLTHSARSAWGLFLQNADTAWYNLADRRCTQAEDMIFAMRDRKPADGFMDWLTDHNDLIANLVEVRQGMYARTGDRKFLERTFEAAEACKTFMIQKLLHETYALQWGGVPDSLYQKEVSYRQRVNTLETNFFMFRMRSNADSLITANDRELFALRDEYGAFLAGLEKNYPEYFKLKYSRPAISLQDIQSAALHQGQCMLDLSILNGKMYALIIRPDTLIWMAMPFDEAAKADLEVFESESRSYSDYQNLPESEYLKRLQAFADVSYRTYHVLIEPLRPYLTGEVILIPRNKLALLPFGALLTRPEQANSKPHLWHYLDNELVLSQTYSAGLFQFIQNRKTQQKSAHSLLALAPFNESKSIGNVELPVGDLSILTRSDKFTPLPSSGVEAESIARIAKGEALLGTQATKANFIKKCSDVRIIHLATHGVANDVLGEFSFIALQSEGKEGGVDPFYARDIFSLRLSAELVVLSACETALGQYRNGEGIIGLTRAFTCAGARNVVASLWSVNDATTKDLMILFYEEIGKGTPYNRALANAKRAFIKKNKAYAHPYFWAGFVLHGR